MSATAPSKTNRKRPAAAPLGPKSKKPHLEKAVDPKGKKRSRPVTTAVLDDSEATSEDETDAEEPDDLKYEGRDEGDETDVGDTPKNPNGA